MDSYDFPKKLGVFLKEHRKKYNISQEAMAHKLKRDRSHYGAIERGEKDLKVSTLYEMSKELGYQVAEIFTIIEKK